MKLKESISEFPFANYLNEDGEAAFTIIFDLHYFIKNATQIINDFHHYGNCVLRDQNTVYGLMFKDTSGDENDIYMKAHVYRWPQYGLIRGGVTFYPGSKNFGEELDNAIEKIK